MIVRLKLPEIILVIILFIIVLIIIIATVYAGLNGTRAQKLLRADISKHKEGSEIFDEIGRLRTKSVDGAIIVVDIAFPYDPLDRQFKEELQKNRAKLKAMALDFFSSKKSDELNGATEGVIKAGLRDSLNGLLSLGSIDTIYFTEFRVIK